MKKEIKLTVEAICINCAYGRVDVDDVLYCRRYAFPYPVRDNYDCGAWEIDLNIFDDVIRVVDEK
jgi:hypothetical protein